MSKWQFVEFDQVHYPYCNTECKPGEHMLGNAQQEHNHPETLNRECGECLKKETNCDTIY